MPRVRGELESTANLWRVAYPIEGMTGVNSLREVFSEEGFGG